MTAPIIVNESAYLFSGDCVEVMRGWPANSVDSIVCDPPYGLRFMGKEWDDVGDGPAQQEWHRVWAVQALRVLKPGGHLIAFGGSRTYHRLASAVEDAGFEIRDSLMWLYGSGFPKSLNLGDGWGTALKPAHEPIILARKPLEGTVAANVQKWGVGALNIDGCRISTTDNLNGGAYSGGARPSSMLGAKGEAGGKGSLFEEGGGRLDAAKFKQPEGRWPANVVLDEEAGAMLDAQSGVSKSTGGKGPASRGALGKNGIYGKAANDRPTQNGGGLGDSGGASRFFYCPKVSKKERNLGCGEIEPKQQDESREPDAPGANNPRNRGGAARPNNHPTVKPVEVMRWLVRLVTPPNGLVLDPFTGSGSTGIAALVEKCRFVGVEREPDYLEIAKARIAAASEYESP